MLAQTIRATAVVGLLAGPAFAELAPLSVDGATTISVEQAATLFDKGVAFVDVRSASDFEGGRIPGAHLLDSDSDFSEDALAAIVALDDPVVMYCNGVHCGRSSGACERAVSWGFTKVYYFREGFPAWDEAGLPIE